MAAQEKIDKLLNKHQRKPGKPEGRQMSGNRPFTHYGQRDITAREGGPNITQSHKRKSF